VAERISSQQYEPHLGQSVHGLDPRTHGGTVRIENTGNFDIAAPAKALFEALYYDPARPAAAATFPRADLASEFFVAKFGEWIAKIDG